MHSQRMVLFFNMGRCNAGQIRHPADDCIFRFHNFGRGISGCSFLEITEVRDRVGFYQLPVVHVRSKPTLQGVHVGR